ncbi:MAG TPA: hypothetical protein VFB52_09550 [Solirubrobacterales bacterium]|nr:hypothetical protein [Solirubrobacterales bacterium]
MAEGERDNTSEWVLPEEARPATLAQLEERIDYAVAVARASEAAALEIGAAAIDAAEQARRAAELAERASGGGVAVAPAVDAPLTEEREAVVVEEFGGDGVVEELEAVTAEPEPAPEPQAEYDSFRAFLERADRISARLESIAR